MLKPRTLKFLAAFIIAFIVLMLPAVVWPKYLDSPIGITLALSYLSIYLFHQIGIPGLLQHNGLCGWGWCAPSIFGWVFLCVFWLGVAWLVAWAAAHATARSQVGD